MAGLSRKQNTGGARDLADELGLELVPGRQAARHREADRRNAL